MVGIVPSSDEYTSIELTGTDRPGLLSEVCAVLAGLRCAVRSAELWTHNTRVAAVVHVTDASSSGNGNGGGGAIQDAGRLADISARLTTLLRGQQDSGSASSSSSAQAHKERRLHQMMSDVDQPHQPEPTKGSGSNGTEVSVTACAERGYTAVVVRCRDRAKLLFDVICTMTDTGYVVHHGTVSSEPGGRAYQEYYIRHVDGRPVRSEPERVRLVRALEAAIERRCAGGHQLELEVRGCDRAGLLSDVTRIFRENGLTIRRAEIGSQAGQALDTFYLADTGGQPVQAKTIDAIRKQVGEATTLRVKHNPFAAADNADGAGTTAFIFGNLFKFYRPFQSLGLVKLSS